jgi:hypothetical protein
MFWAKSKLCPQKDRNLKKNAMLYAVIKWRVDVRTEIVVSVRSGAISEAESKNLSTKNYTFQQMKFTKIHENSVQQTYSESAVYALLFSSHL